MGREERRGRGRRGGRQQVFEASRYMREGGKEGGGGGGEEGKVAETIEKELGMQGAGVAVRCRRSVPQ